VIERIGKILEKKVCDNCLGRQFSQLLTGTTNRERGRALRFFAAMLYEAGELKNVDESNFIGFEFRTKKIKTSKKRCWLCDDIFENLERFSRAALKKIKKYEFSTFLVGCRPPRELLKREEELWEKTGIEFCEPFKAEFNREVGKLIEKTTGKKGETLKPDIVILFDLENWKIEVKSNPLYIFGYYQKLVRGIPQCKWEHYRTSVEQIIARPIMKVSKGVDHSFHGMGREDVSARCLGWRPFVIEIKEPKKRKLDLKKITEEINKSSSVKVRSLRFVDMETVRKVKEARPDKTYRALVVFERPVSEKELKKLRMLVGEIKQKTPTRVLHRRSDITRKRMVKQVKVKKLSPRKAELIIKAEAGLYIKELISGDDGRTSPSVSEILGVKSECRELDVIKIDRVNL